MKPDDRNPWRRATTAVPARFLAAAWPAAPPGRGSRCSPVQRPPVIGDTYYPSLGNPGLRRRAYTLDCPWTRSSQAGPARDIAARASGLLRASPSPGRPELAQVTVSLDPGRRDPAGRQRSWSPRPPLRGRTFTIAVHYQGTPAAPSQDADRQQHRARKVGCHHSGDEFMWPANSAGPAPGTLSTTRPRDKAAYPSTSPWPTVTRGLQRTAPKPPLLTAPPATFPWQSRAPMASYRPPSTRPFTPCAPRPMPAADPQLRATRPRHPDQQTFAPWPSMIGTSRDPLPPYPFESRSRSSLPRVPLSLETRTAPLRQHILPSPRRSSKASPTNWRTIGSSTRSA